jgi:PBP1b-binding outer membrane lipoprotein LpoB
MHALKLKRYAVALTLIVLMMLSGCSSKTVPVIQPVQDCPIINRAPLRITEIPKPVGNNAADYILQLHATIRQCNADKEAVE